MSNEPEIPEKINASHVYKAVRRLFHNYEYKLENSFVYDWECDFFGISKSGYSVEVEIKVSRSDYFNDFKKPKHQLFDSHVRKLTHHIYREFGATWQDRKDRVVCSYINPIISWGRGGKPYMDYRKGKYVINDWLRADVRHERVDVLAPATSIKIKSITEILCPNSLYFACPTGLIKPEEIPAYAGLIYDDQIIKKAPYIHKQKQDLTKVLLQKFYWLWLNRGK